MREMDALFAALAKSPFRSKFRLQGKDAVYLQEKGLPLVLTHAADFVRTRLALAHIPNDGKQTPMRGHPVFVAQHATATCCRGCLQKWHDIAQGHALSQAEQDYVLKVLAAWLERARDVAPQAAERARQLDIFQ